MIMKLSGEQQEEIQKNGPKNGCGNSTKDSQERERAKEGRDAERIAYPHERFWINCPESSEVGHIERHEVTECSSALPSFTDVWSPRSPSYTRREHQVLDSPKTARAEEFFRWRVCLSTFTFQSLDTIITTVSWIT